VTTSEQTNEIGAAMAKAQAAMKPAVKDANNPAFKSKYADLASVWDACRGPLTTNGIAAVQDVTLQGDKIAVTTRLVHSSGQWMEFGPLPVPSMKQDAHGVGSATSYARRYGLSAAVGIVADDDDGNAAVGQPTQQAQAAQPQAAPKQKPSGYDEWLSDMASAADEGWPKLSAAFSKSKPEYRNHVTGPDKDKWKALRAKAEKVAA
jgi:predicted secreted protein